MALATQVLRDASQAAPASPPPGFLLLSPRAGSQLADFGVTGGERLLEIDGQPVQTVSEIQVALRKHALGGEAQLRVGRDAAPSREFRVRHVSDYPGN